LRSGKTRQATGGFLILWPILLPVAILTHAVTNQFNTNPRFVAAAD
jgi:hypothetical protein